MTTSSRNSKQIPLLPLANLLAYLLMLAVNFLANSLPINGLTTGAVSAKYPNLLVPAGYTFGIWGLIYLLLGLFVITQLRYLTKAKEQQPPYVDVIGYWFFLSCLANASWIIAWHYLQLGLNWAIMLLLLTTLILIYQRLSRISWLSKYQQHLVQLPFSIYLAWICIASIANGAAFLKYGAGFSGLLENEWLWAVLMVVVALSLAVFFLWKKQDYAFAMVIIWALTGILMQLLRSATPAPSILVHSVQASIGILSLSLIVKAIFQLQRSA